MGACEPETKEKEAKKAVSRSLCMPGSWRTNLVLQEISAIVISGHDFANKCQIYYLETWERDKLKFKTKKTVKRWE